MPHERGLPQRNERADHAKQTMMSKALKGKYGNSMYDYGNHTEGGIHITHWKNRTKPYGGSNQGGASIGGGSAG